MTDWRVTGIRLITDTVSALARSQLTAITVRPRMRAGRAPTGIPSPGGCPICEAHKIAGHGYLLLEGLAGTVRAEGEIPPGVGGTLALARSEFESARAVTATIGARDPRLQPRCAEIDALLRGLERELRGQVGPAQVPGLAARARAAWQACYGLASDAYRSDRDPVASELREIRREIADVRETLERTGPPPGQEESHG